MGVLLQDLRFALRQLRRSPGFTAVAVLTLAFGIGSTTAIFTLVYDVMLRPLPFEQPDRLVNIEEKVAEWSNILPTAPVSANHFTFWQQHQRSFSSMTLMSQGSAPLGSSNGRPMQVGVLAATPGIFSVLRVQPWLGRAFTASEAQPGRDHVAVLTYDLWREQFGSDTGILGKTIPLDGFPYTVVGVMPASFHMPLGSPHANSESYRPAPIGVLEPLAFSQDELAEEMGDLNYFGLARLKDRVSVAAARQDLDALQRLISANLPADERSTLSAVITPFQEQLVGTNRMPLILLLAAVAALLLVGCVNVTNLLLARAVGQKHQMALAAALGATRAEMLRMSLRETTILAAVGGGLGVLLAAVIVPAMQRYLPAALDFRGPLHLDWAGAGCAVLLAVLATLLAGAAPAFLISRTAPQEVLRGESRTASEPRGSRRMRRLLVGTEIAISVALVLMTGLLSASLLKLMRVDRGFSAERTVTAVVDLPEKSYSDRPRRAEFYREVLGQLKRLPGVEDAAYTSVLPLTGDSWGDMARAAGDTRPAAQLPLESFRSVSPAFFSTIHLQLVAGRVFSEGDWGRNLALVSEKTAKNLWPGKDPIGRQFSRGDPKEEKPFTVVGVVANARTISLAKPDPMMVYVPYWYRVDSTAGLVVRTRQNPTEMANVIRQTIWNVDGSVPVPTVRALGTVAADSVANQRFEMELLFLFAASALLLAGLGVYGVVTYSVVQRSREIGVRMALGAQRGSVYRLVLRDGLVPVLCGVGAGVAIAFGFARVVSGLLFEVSPYDPLLTAAAVCVLIVVGIVACLLPARRAASIDPIWALRRE